MSIRIGYLLPTRERIMAGQPQAAPLLELAERAERLGFDSVWAGDSLLARPRHEPLTLLAAVASRVRRVDIGTAVLLPALRNPVLLAHQVATLDQVAEGRLILGVGIAADVPNIRQEFTAAGVPFEKSDACSKVFGSPVRCGAVNRSIGTAGGKWSMASLARHHIVKVGPRSGSADRCPRASIARVASSTAGCRSPRLLINGLAYGTSSSKSHARRGAMRTR